MGRVFVQEGHNLAEVPPNAFPSLLAPAGSSQLAAWGSGIQMSAATEDSRIFPRHGFPAFGLNSSAATRREGRGEWVTAKETQAVLQ